jgi:predicted nucleotide-binding protein (sugar kinase/HSP70/actin superfamily)
MEKQRGWLGDQTEAQTGSSVGVAETAPLQGHRPELLHPAGNWNGTGPQKPRHVKGRGRGEGGHVRCSLSAGPVEHFRRPVEHPFTLEQREHTTVLIGGLSPRHNHLVEAALQALGYRCKALPNVSLAGYELAKEYGNNGLCNPTYFTVGCLVKYVQDLEASGMTRKEIIDTHVFLTAGSCGTCRFGMYEAEYRFALANAGFGGFRVLLFGPDDGLDQTGGMKAGLEMNLDFFLGLISAFTIADVLNQFQYQIRGYEAEEGSVDSVTDEVLDDIHELIRTRKPFDLANSRARFMVGTRFEGRATYMGKILHPLRSTHLVKALREAGRKYDRVELDPFRVRPIVRITGEFWAQMTEGDGNFNVHRFLQREGAEVSADQCMFTRLMFLLHMHKEGARDRRGLRGGSGRLGHYLAYLKKRGTLTLAEWILKRENGRLIDAMGGTLHEMADQYELERLAEPYWNWRTNSGESHLEIAENIYYHSHHLCHMVLSLKPFTCLPSTQSDGVQARVVEDLPGMILLPNETTGVGELKAHSRIQMALGAARVKARKEMREAVARTGRRLEEMKAFVADHPELRRATYRIPHHEGVVGRAANFVLHVSNLMDKRPALAPEAR